ncbi:MAG: PD40 domain-containing protein [Gemmatimonadetes bacterium]|nr:PD40 domain-containing protein [Gemmatimonadota bacterium]
MKLGAAAVVTGLLVLATTGTLAVGQPPVAQAAQEVHLRNIRQLTFEGENAEAYWSEDGKKLIFQSRHGRFKCDQIFTLDLETGEQKLVSSGKGRTTCAYFLQGDKRIVYASTHLADVKCPPPVMMVGRTGNRPEFTARSWGNGKWQTRQGNSTGRSSGQVGLSWGCPLGKLMTH